MKLDEKNNNNKKDDQFIRQSKLLFSLEWVIAGLSILVLFGPIFVAAFFDLPTWARILMIIGGFVVSFFGFICCMIIERETGYFECPHCHYKHVPSYKQIFGAMHMGRTRYLKCPKCNKKGWQKKVLE